MRVVSLLPSTSETLIAWGITPVAVTRFCEQPGLPTVGGTKDPDVAAIVALAPDLVVMDTEENRREDADALTAAGMAVHVTRVHSVGDVASALEGLAAAVGDGAFEAPASDEAAPGSRRRLAFVPIWRRPWMTINDDTYGSSALAAAGIDNVFGDHDERYPTVTLEEVVSRRPDLVVAPSEPYPFGERQRAELETVAPVVFVDGQDLFWWGVRTPAALDRLAAALR